MPTPLFDDLVTRQAQARLNTEWLALERELTPLLKRLTLNQLVSTEDAGFDQTLCHGLEVRDITGSRVPMHKGRLRLDCAALVELLRRSHCQGRYQALRQQLAAELETKLLALLPAVPA